MVVPNRYKNARYEDVPENIKECLKDMSTKGVYLYGPVGTGKTHILWAIMNHAKEICDKENKIFNFEFWNTTRLLYEIRQEFNDKCKKYDTMGDLLASNRVLLLDDIGAEKLSDWVLETFYLLINTRYEKMLPTIFTSNFSISELAERIGDRTASRIVEMCNVVEIKGNDRRLI